MAAGKKQTKGYLGEMKTYKRWDHAMNDLFAAKGIAKLIKSIDRKHAEARGIIWDFVSASIAAQETFHNEFLAYCESQKVDPEEFINSLWHPLDYFIENRAKVIEAVRSGMTRRAFMAGSASGWLLERPLRKTGERRVVSSQRGSPIPVEPEDDGPERLSPVERADRWRVRAIALEARCNELKAEIRKIKKGVAEVVAQNRKLIRQLNAIGRGKANAA